MQKKKKGGNRKRFLKIFRTIFISPREARMENNNVFSTDNYFRCILRRRGQFPTALCSALKLSNAKVLSELHIFRACRRLYLVTFKKERTFRAARLDTHVTSARVMMSECTDISQHGFFGGGRASEETLSSRCRAADSENARRCPNAVVLNSCTEHCS